MFEMFQLPFMVQAFEVALITGLVLAYLGVHVVGRGIVFVDLALGQISSLGVAFGVAIGSENQYIPIVFTLIGALLLSFIKIRDKRLKQEAIIGIVYALASALTVMLISKTAHGDTEIQDVLFGSILSVTTDQIKTIAIIFGIIALLHLVFFRKIFQLTEQYENGMYTNGSVAEFLEPVFLHLARFGDRLCGKSEWRDSRFFIPDHSVSFCHHDYAIENCNIDRCYHREFSRSILWIECFLPL